MIPNEAIVLTRNSHINAAAIGVYIDGEFYRLRVFENSNTYSNLTKNDYFSINFVGEEKLALLVQCALRGHNNEEEEIKEEEILFWHQIPYLKEAHAIIARVLSREVFEVEDCFGRAKCLSVRALQVERFGNEVKAIRRDRYIPILECAVLTSKYFEARAEAKLRIREEVKAMLKEVSGFEEEVRLIKKILALD